MLIEIIGKFHIYIYMCVYESSGLTYLLSVICILLLVKYLSTKLASSLWHDKGESVEQSFFRTRLDWFEDSTQSVWNVCINFDTWKNIEKCTVLEEIVSREN